MPDRVFHAGRGFHVGRGLQPLMPDGVCNPVRNILSSCRGSQKQFVKLLCIFAKLPHAGRGLQPRPKYFVLMPGFPQNNFSCRTHAGRGLQPRPKYFVLMPGFPKAICKIALHLCKITLHLTSCRLFPYLFPKSNSLKTIIKVGKFRSLQIFQKRGSLFPEVNFHFPISFYTTLQS